MEEPVCRWPFDSQEHRLIEKYIRLTRLHRSVTERLLEGTGVYRSQHQILMFVSNSPNVSQKELADMYGVSGATIAVSLKKLEKGGYIERVVDRNDNRCNQICITQKGGKVVEESVMIFRRLESRMFEGFTMEDMELFGSLLDRLAHNLNQGFSQCGPDALAGRKIVTEREEN